jgi:hypothetical protein
MPFPIPAEVLKHAREAGGLSQAVLAKRMETVPSVLSKLEKADDAEPEMGERYLTAIGSQLAKEIQDYYARPWLHERPPSFLHPDAEALWVIDQALKDLDAFEAENNDPILRGPLGLLRGELRTTDNYLRRRDHIVAWVGDIGVGKTTALTYAVGLLVGDGRSGRKPAFPVGSGRTTVCETAIRVAPTFGIVVDALDDEDVVRLTRDMVSSLTPDGAGVGVAAEIARVLRNMAGMRPVNSMAGDDPVSIDPITELIASGLGVEEVTDRLIVEMKLADRKERQIILPEGSEDGLTWVSRLVSNINNGLDRRFGVPSRITVLMPSKNLSADGQQLQVVDTRGIESVTQRKDLIELGEDARTLMVLCTKFADAPNATVQRLLQDSIDGLSDASERRRKCILVLPRGDEALEVPGFDEPLTSRPQGYAIRRKDVEQALSKAQLPKTPIYFFDARNDEPDKVWKTLRSQVRDMRAVYSSRARAAAAGVANLRENIDAVLAAEARLDVERDMTLVLGQASTLPDSMRPAYQNLIDQMAIGHHSSIAASVARRGDWDAFNFAQILGQGVRVDANHRTNRLVLRIEHQLEHLEKKWTDLAAVKQSLHGLRVRLIDGQQEFLSSARGIGRDAYGTLLAGQGEVWVKSARRYGMGSGYKRDVADIWRDWFVESEDASQTAASVGQRLNDAWVTWVLEPLREATRADVVT